MGIYRQTLEMRGIPRQEIFNYFLTIGGQPEDDLKILGKNWEVEISQEKRVTLGKFSLLAVFVIFSSEKEQCDKLIRDFRFRFLSAGG